MAGGDGMFPCPSCGESFSIEAIVAHSEECGEKQRKSKEKELESALSEDIIALLRPPDRTPSDSRNDADELIPGLYLGNSDAARNSEWQREKGILEIVNVADDVSPSSDASPTAPHVSHFPLSDSTRVDILPLLPSIAEAISRGMDNGPTLVHCSAGASRSATAATAFLVLHREKSLLEALQIVRKHRPIAYPNKSFFRALIDLETTHRGSTTLPTAALALHEDDT